MPSKSRSCLPQALCIVLVQPVEFVHHRPLATFHPSQAKILIRITPCHLQQSLGGWDWRSKCSVGMWLVCRQGSLQRSGDG